MKHGLCLRPSLALFGLADVKRPSDTVAAFRTLPATSYYCHCPQCQCGATATRLHGTCWARSHFALKGPLQFYSKCHCHTSSQKVSTAKIWPFYLTSTAPPQEQVLSAPWVSPALPMRALYSCDVVTSPTLPHQPHPPTDQGRFCAGGDGGAWD